MAYGCAIAAEFRSLYRPLSTCFRSPSLLILHRHLATLLLSRRAISGRARHTSSSKLINSAEANVSRAQQIMNRRTRSIGAKLRRALTPKYWPYVRRWGKRPIARAWSIDIPLSPAMSSTSEQNKQAPRNHRVPKRYRQCWHDDTDCQPESSSCQAKRDADFSREEKHEARSRIWRKSRDLLGKIHF